MVTYLNGKAPELDKIDQEYQAFFTLRRMGTGWGYIGPSGNHECTTVSPGADGFMEVAFISKYVNHGTVDTNALRQHGKSVIKQRQDGRVFEGQLLRARQANPEMIFISGWNDWAYCRGRVVLRGKLHVDAKNNGREQIIITETPYQVNIDGLCDRIAQLTNEKAIEGISDVRNELNEKEGIRIVIDLRRDAVANVVINQLYKHTELQTSYGINNVALVKGRPRTLNVREIISEFVELP